MDLPRIYPKTTESFFLFGPRGVGKSSFVRDVIKPDLSLNLLESALYLELKRNPSQIEAKTAMLKQSSLVFIDEIQKVPPLLDEVHRLIEERKLRFVMTGSSARKLKREGANLLAGRALTKKMFPFSVGELQGKFPIKRLLETGTLPLVLNHAAQAEDVLSSYVETYLKEEIREEALTRDLDDFSRFLEISAQLSGRVLNYENISSEAGKSGDTIKKWYSILEETFLGVTVPAYRPGFKVRETAHSKFYYFDCGVARASAGLIREEMDSPTRGFALETLVLNELRIYNEISRKDRKISFYGAPGGDEIDFIVETQKKTVDRPGSFVSIEVKSAERWRRDFEGPSRSLRERAGKKHRKMLGVYLGKEELIFDDFHVIPLELFVKKLFVGELY